MGTLQQDLSEEAKFEALCSIYLFFKEQGQRPTAEVLAQALSAAFGPVDLVADTEGSLTTFALLEHLVTYADEQKVPAQVLMADFAPFDPASIDEMARSQLWDHPDGQAILDECAYQLMISDFMAAGLDYPERCQVLTTWLETALGLFEDCVAVWVPTSGKLLTRQQVLDDPMQGGDRFIYWAVNVRFFNIEGSSDKVIDTLGLYAIGLPDVQYHFHDLDPDQVVNHAYSTASYIFANNVPIKSGETIDGLWEGRIDPEVRWRCQYEMALIQPAREVLDICPGPFAAGGRQAE